MGVLGILVLDEEFIKKYTRATDSSRNKHLIEFFLKDLDVSNDRKIVLSKMFKDAENYRWPVQVVQLLIKAVNEVYGYE
jgi:hypothetical protein